MENYDFIIIGGGPAGMMAAGRAGERRKKVILLEKTDRLGKKLLLCASGRCNVTNVAPLPVFKEAYGREGGNFLHTALELYSNESLRSFLSSFGVKTVIEQKGRVFPESQKASSVLKALEEYLYRYHVTIKTNSRVVNFITKNKSVKGVKTQDGTIFGRNVLVATGGLSYPSTGSNGDGYTLARSVGHRINETYPAIVAFETGEKWVKLLQGTPIKNVLITSAHQGKKINERFGEALFTHYGISGPAILDISKGLVKYLSGGPVVIRIDFKPKHTGEKFDAMLLVKFKRHGGKTIKSCMRFFIPEKLVPIFLTMCKIDQRKKVSQITTPERKKILKYVKGFPLTLIRHRPIEESIVTAGGVSLKEVNGKTMGSRLIQGLFFAGEVLDIDGPTGGFNLQAAFSTGYLAGNSVEM